MIDFDREELAISALKWLGIPDVVWGSTIEPRALNIQGKDDPWDVTICTLVSVDAAVQFFGVGETERTYVCGLEVDCMVDVAKEKRDLVNIRVEIGRAGSYHIWESFGKKGLVVLPPGDAGSWDMMSLTLDQNPKTYTYVCPEWQVFATQQATKHLTEAVYHDLDQGQINSIQLKHYSTHALVPLKQAATKGQSAYGIRVHFLVRGLLFDSSDLDDADGLGKVECNPIPLVGTFPNGHLSSDGLIPLTSDDVPVRVTYPHMSKPPVVHGGSSYCVAAQEAYEDLIAQAADAKGVAPDAVKWESYKSHRRSAMRRKSKAKAKAGGGGKGGKVDGGKGAGKGGGGPSHGLPGVHADTWLRARGAGGGPPSVASSSKRKFVEGSDDESDYSASGASVGSRVAAQMKLAQISPYPN